MAKQPAWIQAEYRYLDSHWGRTSDARVVDGLERISGVRRTVGAVYQRAWRVLRLRRRDQTMSMTTVMRFLDIDHHTIESLCRTGELLRRRAPFGAGKVRQWRMDPRRLEYFLLHEPWKYDVRRLNPATRTRGQDSTDLYALLAEVQALHARDPWLTLAEAGPLVGYGHDRLQVIATDFAKVGKAELHRRRIHTPGDHKSGGPIVLRRSEYSRILDEHQLLIGARLKAGRRNARAMQRELYPDRLCGWLVLPPPTPRPTGTERISEGGFARVVAPPADQLHTQGRIGVVRRIYWARVQRARAEREAIDQHTWKATIALPHAADPTRETVQTLPLDALLPIFVEQARAPR